MGYASEAVKVMMSYAHRIFGARKFVSLIVNLIPPREMFKKMRFDVWGIRNSPN